MKNTNHLSEDEHIIVELLCIHIPLRTTTSRVSHAAFEPNHLYLYTLSTHCTNYLYPFVQRERKIPIPRRETLIGTNPYYPFVCKHGNSPSAPAHAYKKHLSARCSTAAAARSL